jgi:hypothetical protein
MRQIRIMEKNSKQTTMRHKFPVQAQARRHHPFAKNLFLCCLLWLIVNQWLCINH